MEERKEISIEKKGDREIHRHPAFGMIGFCQSYGGERTLFGSSISHNNVVILELKHAYSERGLCNDYHYGRGLITRVEMSYSQFAELVSNPNNGDGIPCTIRFTEKDGSIPAIASNISKRKQFEDEFSEHLSTAMAQVQAQIDRIKESLTEKKSLGVKDRKEMISQLQQVQYNIGCNLEFCATQFNEQMDKTVLEAKGEVEAFVQNKIRDIAYEAIAEKGEHEKIGSKNPISMPEE